MKFRTEIDIKPYPFSILHHHSLLFTGSCFSDHIGSFFKNVGFKAVVNPFGTLFNPLSIKLAIDIALGKISFDERFIHFFNEKWISFAHHGSFSNPDKSLFLTNIQHVFAEIKQVISQSDYLFITFGTAYYYRYLSRDLIVANCHKIPSYEFEKERLTVNETVLSYKELIDSLHAVNEKVKVIFTVSPVRHLGDGFHENQISKSILHLAIDELVDNENIFYFPAYELIMDDLRDYRFYAQDLCHPAEQAIQYIKEKIEIAFFSQDTLAKVREFEKVNRRSGHQKSALSDRFSKE